MDKWDKLISEFEVSVENLKTRIRTEPEVKDILMNRIPQRHLEHVDFMTITSLEELEQMMRRPGVQALAIKSRKHVLIVGMPDITVPHETGHQVFWHSQYSKVRHVDEIYDVSLKTGKGFVSEYSKVSIDEFFAECYRVYLENPAFLKARNPKMWAVMEKL